MSTHIEKQDDDLFKPLDEFPMAKEDAVITVSQKVFLTIHQTTLIWVYTDLAIS